MLLIVSPNINIDRTYVIPRFLPGEIFRPDAASVYAGGKGVNVARIFLQFGGAPLLTGFVGGRNGSFIRDSLQKERIPADLIEMPGESRVCTIIADDVGRDTVINEPGPSVTEEMADQLLERISALMKRAALLAICGSLPGGLSPRLYVESIRMAERRGIPVLLDAAGENLRQGAAERPYLVKPNLDELAGLLKFRPEGLPEIAAAVRPFIIGGTSAFLVSLGAQGALLVERGCTVHFKQPPLKISSCVGCGDALLAGCLWGVHSNFGLRRSVRYGMAAAGANALMPGPGLCRMEDVMNILPEITEEMIS